MPDENSEKPKSSFKPMPTIYALRELIERCFEESRQCGYLRVIDKVTGTTIVHDERKLAQHIAMTIIGELKELEIIRKIGPAFRLFRQLENDFNELDTAAVEDFRLRNLRRTPPEGEGTGSL